MLQGFFDLWPHCLGWHRFRSQMWGWVQCPGFICITQRYFYFPLLLQLGGGKCLCHGMGAGGGSWVMGIPLVVLMVRGVWCLHPHRSGKGLLCWPGASLCCGSQLDALQTTRLFPQKSTFGRKASRPLGFPFLLFFMARAFLPLPRAAHLISHRLCLMPLEMSAGRIFWRFPGSCLEQDSCPHEQWFY